MKYSFIISTLIALVLITIVSIYSYPLGLRGYFSEGFQSSGNAVMDLKMARSNLARKEGFQGTGITPVRIPPATANRVGTTGTNPTLSMPTSMPSMPSMPSMNTAAPMPPTPPMPPMPPMDTSAPMNPTQASSTPMPNAAMMANSPTMPSMDMSGAIVQGFKNMNMSENQGSSYRKEMREGFRGNYAEVSNGVNAGFNPMGAYDGVTLPTGNKVSTWRHTAPDEPLLGAPFKVGDNDLFIFKNNQCKPECCGSSFSCSGGCVCTTPEQRDYINGRGGNRTAPAED